MSRDALSPAARARAGAKIRSKLDLMPRQAAWCMESSELSLSFVNAQGISGQVSQHVGNLIPATRTVSLLQNIKNR